MMAEPSRAGTGGRAASEGLISAIDVLKLVAIAAMMADHVGLYFLTEIEVLRVIGRPAALIFGFLIGFAGRTRIPPAWIVIGLGLSVLELVLRTDEDEHVTLDILVALALARALVPALDALYARGPAAFLGVAVGLAVLIPSTNYFIEYGSEVGLLALAGVARRLEATRPNGRLVTIALMIGAGAAIAAAAVTHFKFSTPASVAMVLVIFATMGALALFKSTSVSGPGPWASAILRWCGRHTLEIYAAHIALFAIVRWLLDYFDPT